MIKAALDENNALVKSETAPRMIGEIKYFAMNTPPSHCLACDGSAVSRTTYAALFAAIGTTWGAGDGSSTFNLPDLRGEWVQGAGTNAVGADIAEGLPNIAGNSYFRNYGEMATNEGYIVLASNDDGGPFTTSYPDTDTRHFGDYLQGITTAWGYAGMQLNFNASRASSIYGASDHVIPKSKALKACIIYE